MQKETKQRIKTYAIAIAIPLAIGGLSALLTRNSMDIYKEVAMPPLSPPSWLFPVVWGILYLLMGISSGIIWENRERDPFLIKSTDYRQQSTDFGYAVL